MGQPALYFPVKVAHPPLPRLLDGLGAGTVVSSARHGYLISLFTLRENYNLNSRHV